MYNSYSECIPGVNIQEATKAGVRGVRRRVLGDEVMEVRAVVQIM